jgi:hypothetical protein
MRAEGARAKQFKDDWRTQLGGACKSRNKSRMIIFVLIADRQAAAMRTGIQGISVHKMRTIPI